MYSVKTIRYNEVTWAHVKFPYGTKVSYKDKKAVYA